MSKSMRKPMKVSELIARLEAVKAAIGDAPCRMAGGEPIVAVNTHGNEVIIADRDDRGEEGDDPRH